MLTETTLFCSIALGIAPIQTKTQFQAFLRGYGRIVFPFPHRNYPSYENHADVTGWITASQANKWLDIPGILWCGSNISILIFILNSKIALVFETEMLN